MLADLSEVKNEVIRKTSEIAQLKTGNATLLADLDMIMSKHEKEKRELVDKHTESLKRSIEDAKLRWDKVRKNEWLNRKRIILFPEGGLGACSLVNGGTLSKLRSKLRSGFFGIETHDSPLWKFCTADPQLLHILVDCYFLSAHGNCSPVDGRGYVGVNQNRMPSLIFPGF